MNSFSKCSLLFWLITLIASPINGFSQKDKALYSVSSPRKIIGIEILDSVEIKPFSILQYDVLIKCSRLSVSGYSFLKFYDRSDRELLSYSSGKVSSLSYQHSGNYTEAPPFTKYMKIGIQADSPVSGYLLSDSLDVKMNIGQPAVQKKPSCNLDDYMKPFWDSDTIYNETVLMYGDSGSPASGKLMFKPDQIVSVKRFDLAMEYLQGKDFIMNGNIINRADRSAMPYVQSDFFDRKNDLAWYDLQSRWIVVTYTHHDSWGGPIPGNKSGQLPGLMSKLKSALPVKIIGYGMSITRGLDVSSYDDVPPYMPTYLDLFARQLRKIYANENIEMFNAGLPGALVSWGAEYADKYINPLHPDLVIIDFGMNDFWRYTPLEFKAYVQTIMSKVKSDNSAAEFLLISNMDFDPDYILDSDKYKNFYVSNMHGYKSVLRDLETPGVVNLDMTTLSDVIYQSKKARDCIANPLHPNDYLARWYAQALTAIFSP